MISIVNHNCNGFINENLHDSRAKMLTPLALLTNNAGLEKEDRDSIIYKKACDLYTYITNLSENSRYKRYHLLAAELQMKYGGSELRKYGLMPEEELTYIIDFIDTYGGFRVYQ